MLMTTQLKDTRLKDQLKYKNFQENTISDFQEIQFDSEIEIDSLKNQINETNGGYEVNGNQKLRELNHLKEDIKLINDSSKTLKKTIKEQNKIINDLDYEIQNIKSNIDYAKGQQEKANSVNSAKENKKVKAEINLEDLSEEELIEEIKKYLDSIRKLDTEIKEQEKYQYFLEYLF